MHKYTYKMRVQLYNDPSYKFEIALLTKCAIRRNENVKVKGKINAH